MIPGWDHPEIRALVQLALKEDIGTGDLTSEACVDEDRQAIGRYFAREKLVLAGVELLPLIFGKAAEVKLKKESGERASSGDVVAEVRGAARLLLSCERTSLNFLQRLSGIATLARQYATAVAHTKCKVLDTRKTTPGLRRLEKLAAAAGGVQNHRIGLWDSILIKNNHITAAGGVTPALERVKYAKVPVEIEVRTVDEMREALAAGATHLLLDNLTPHEAREWIAEIGGRATVEVSGKIRLERLRDYAEAGADYVSCGAITHSAKAVDLNFRIELT